MTDKAVKTIHIKEEDFFQQILDLAHIFGWRVAHFRPARTKNGWRTAVAGDGAGFPDVVMVKSPRLIFAELKSEKGKLTPEQEEWLDGLGSCGDAVRQLGHLVDKEGVEVYLWRPSDLDNIIDILR